MSFTSAVGKGRDGASAELAEQADVVGHRRGCTIVGAKCTFFESVMQDAGQQTAFLADGRVKAEELAEEPESEVSADDSSTYQAGREPEDEEYLHERVKTTNAVQVKCGVVFFDICEDTERTVVAAGACFLSCSRNWTVPF